MSLKDDYFTAMTLQFRRWDAQFGMLNDKRDQMSGPESVRLDEQLKALRDSRQAAHRSLLEVRSASESGWRRIQSELDSTWTSMKRALDHALSEARRQP